MTKRPRAMRNYKDTVFRMLFREKKELLELYNALNGTHHENPNDLEVYTLKNAIYMNFKNDVSFLLDSELNLFEQQASYNPNMPLRFLIYITRQYEKYVRDKSLYSSQPVKIPVPRFVVFYNGAKIQPEREIRNLSDLFEKKVEDPELDLKVLTLNINAGNNQELLEKCRTLKEYCIYVERVRRYAEEMPVQEAVERAVNECIREGILADFLLTNKAEVIAMSIFEYDEERELKKIRKDEYELGKEEGRREGHEEGRREGHEEGRREGHEEGRREGYEEGRIQEAVEVYQEIGKSKEEALLHIQKKFSLSQDNAVSCVDRYWK